MKEALLYDKGPSRRVTCRLCAHRCGIDEGAHGICGVRQNTGGILSTLAYGEIIAAHVDPIEKKPLYHFLPGSRSYSIAAAGCNFRCGFCQNWEISQPKGAARSALPSMKMTPEEIVRAAQRSSCESISYTYTEPTIFFEYARDTALLAKERGISNVFVTNGYMTGDCLAMLEGLLDAANVDLKAFDDTTYRRVCGARLQPVLDSIATLHAMGVWVEVTTLIVPGVNDDETSLRSIAAFLAGVSREIPWHISRFYPQYQMNDLQPTDINILKRARQIGTAAGLRSVYLGNVHGDEDSTFCYNCGTVIIERSGYEVRNTYIEEGRCPKCRNLLHGRWRQTP
ncbi:MAG: AmmeMemoRadiSam system radical SAM enzyme [Candidatus Omnitrophota bacterium]